MLVIELHRKSTVDQAADVLRQWILGGEIPAGTPLRETRLAERLGISRNTVRETLLLLERETLVRHETHRGARVASPSVEDVADIFEVRATLESEGLRRAATGAPASLVALRRAVEALEVVAARGEWDRYADSEAGFHQALVDALGSPRMSELEARVLGELRLVLVGVDREHRSTKSPPPHIAEHRVIVELLQEGRIGEAISLLNRHLGEAAENVMRYLRSAVQEEE